jgi:hypothetical protein
MKKIKVEIIISGLEDWGTDWNNESSVEVTLNDYNQYVSEYRESQIEKILD